LELRSLEVADVQPVGVLHDARGELEIDVVLELRRRVTIVHAADDVAGGHDEAGDQPGHHGREVVFRLLARDDDGVYDTADHHGEGRGDEAGEHRADDAADQRESVRAPREAEGPAPASEQLGAGLESLANRVRDGLRHGTCCSD
jgi:hypothetical protein